MEEKIRQETCEEESLYIGVNKADLNRQQENKIL